MENKTFELSRRGFIGGMAGAGALAALGLAGCSTPASNATENEDSQAAAVESTTPSTSSTSSDWLGSAPQIAESDIIESKDTDLLIVGAGNGGMAAAAYAAEQGVDFLVAEFGKSVGSTRHWFAAVDTEPFTSQGVSVDRQRLMGEITRYAQGNADMRLIQMWMNESNDMFKFVDSVMTVAGEVVVADEYDMPDGMGGTDYYTPPFEHHYVLPDGGRGEKGRNELFEDLIKEKGHEVLYEHDLACLVREEGGRVTGAIFETPDGFVQINATKAVLLTTGGYSANPEMLTALSPVTVKSVTSLGYNMYNKGKGIRAAMWAGAAKDLTSATMIFDRGLVPPGTKAGYTEESAAAGDPTWPTTGQFNPGTQPFLKVNILGERFANESADYDYLPHAAAQQPNGTYISIWDGNFVEDVKRFHTLGCSAMTRMMADGMVEEGGLFDEKVAEGSLQKADTLEELAEKLLLPKDTFLATVERYNELYDKQVDEDFGKEAYRLSSLRTPPFYGAPLGGTLLTTIDGIRINHDCQALDTEGYPIEGLYAAGDCSGSVFSGCYPDQLHGFACGRTMTEALHVVKLVKEQ